MSIPKVLVKAAVAKKANIGRQYDSAGKHVAYWYRAPGSDWKVYRATVSGLLHMLRFA